MSNMKRLQEEFDTIIELDTKYTESLKQKDYLTCTGMYQSLRYEVNDLMDLFGVKTMFEDYKASLK